MAHTSSIAMAPTSPTKSVAIPRVRGVGDTSGTASYEQAANALLTPPTSASPELLARVADDTTFSPHPINVEHDIDVVEKKPDNESVHLQQRSMPLSKGALSDLDGSQTITPSLLAKHHLPGIMLGNGPRPIRYVMGELTQTVPGFSRIPPAKARRIVVAALESRSGGGLDGNVEFCKTGWGRWDAHVKGSSTKDSGIGSFNDDHFSPPRSEHSSYALSYNDSAMHMPVPGKHREHHSGGSWTASSIREEDEFNMDMDPLEEVVDQMSLDGNSDDSSSMDEDETDDEDWAAVGVDALRKASLPESGMPRHTQRAVSIPYTGPWVTKSWNRSTSTARPIYSESVPCGNHFSSMQTPEERAAIEALLSMGSM